ncbi:ectoine/hydroxyectoine ABC transporter substrate-binding protein EhuB, partial [Mycolicibacterium elephantis]
MNSTRRNFLRVGKATGALALSALLVLTGCSRVPESGEGGTLQRVKDANSIKIGIAGEVPYGYTADGEVTGEAPEVA